MFNSLCSFSPSVLLSLVLLCCSFSGCHVEEEMKADLVARMQCLSKEEMVGSMDRHKMVGLMVFCDGYASVYVCVCVRGLISGHVWGKAGCVPLCFRGWWAGPLICGFSCIFACMCVCVGVYVFPGLLQSSCQ